MFSGIIDVPMISCKNINKIFQMHFQFNYCRFLMLPDDAKAFAHGAIAIQAPPEFTKMVPLVIYSFYRLEPLQFLHKVLF